MIRCVAVGVLVLAATVVGTGRAQAPSIRGYYLNVGLGSVEGPLSPAGVSDFQRLRLMSGASTGPVRLDVAYEHALTLVSSSGAGGAAGNVGRIGGGNEWLPLQGTIERGEHAAWTHRIDRLVLTMQPAPSIEIGLGRQTISWATTLLLTPADPFAPFDPSEPFRQYRAGVDAARMRVFTGAFSDVDVVVRATDTERGETVTALGRVKGLVGVWEFAGWGGVVHDEVAASLAATTTTAGWALRTEAVIRREDADAVLRWTVGVDRNVTIGGQDVYVVLEYQRDGFGAASADELLSVLQSDAAARSELQVAGRDVVAAQASMQISPVVAGAVLAMGNLNDPSLLLTPSISYAAADEVSISGGLFVGIGTGTTPAGAPGSEFGPVPLTGYVALSLFF